MLNPLAVCGLSESFVLESKLLHKSIITRSDQLSEDDKEKKNLQKSIVQFALFVAKPTSGISTSTQVLAGNVGIP